MNEKLPPKEIEQNPEFGEVVSVLHQDGPKRCVVVDLMEHEQNFVGASLINSENSEEERLGLPGTISIIKDELTPSVKYQTKEYLGRTGETWDNDRILRAFARHFGYDTADTEAMAKLATALKIAPKDTNES